MGFYFDKRILPGLQEVYLPSFKLIWKYLLQYVFLRDLVLTNVDLLEKFFLKKYLIIS
jgi:hypothetical protein